MLLVLPGELTIAHALELKAELLSALQGGEPLELDGRGVTDVDVAGLQVLWAAGRTARAKGKAVAFLVHGQSQPLAEAIATAGLGNHGDDGWPGEGCDNA